MRVSVAPAAAILFCLTTPTVARPPVDVVTWLAGRPPGDAVRNLDGPPTAYKVRLGGVSRNAVPAGGERTWTTAVASGDALDLAMSVVCLAAGGPCAKTVAFEMRAEVEGEAAKILHRSEIRRDGFSRWHQRRVDLAALAGRDVRFRFVVTADGGADLAKWTGMMPLWGEPLRVRADPRRANVILVSLDTLRADRVGSYGHHRDTSPNLDALARGGFRFDQAISQAPWTTPAHASIFTSLHPSSHKVAMPFAALSSRAVRFLAPGVTTLAEVLRERGLRTVAVTGGGTMSAVFGFDQGFDHYQEFASQYASDSFNPPSGEHFADFWQAAVERLAAVRSAPFFLFLHTFEIHAPYVHLEYARPLLEPRQFEELTAIAARGRDVANNAEFLAYLEREGLLRKEVTSALYDGGVRFVDQNLVAPLLRELESAGIADDTIVVVTSDHGEEFGEHRPEAIYGAHGGNLYDSLIRVPLIVRAPREKTSGRVVREQVRSIDIAPTILDLLEIPVPAQMEGRSLVPLMRGAAAGVPPPAVSEATSQGPEWKSIRDGRYKLLYVTETANDDQSPRVGLRGEPVREYLFDVAADPGEQTDLGAQQSDTKAELGAALRRLLRESAAKDFGEAKPEALDDDVIERLRALGYVE